MSNGMRARVNSVNFTNHLTLVAFILSVLIGGSNAVAVGFSNLELPPFWGAAISLKPKIAKFAERTHSQGRVCCTRDYRRWQYTKLF